MTRCFIAIGSNLQQPLDQVNRAVTELAALPDCSLQAVSRWYQSNAIGPGTQPDYINGVAELNSQQSPIALLRLLQSIENCHHRKRLQRWGPRTLDLDLLIYGELIVDDPDLTIPHPRMLERNFVLYPLMDIAPDLILPNGLALSEFITSCPSTGLHLVQNKSSNTMPQT
ncbi:MAG: 2-amino-4-hydroxy-6-hydroxymethyldihydropteridine diphosphokinase [Oceanicoccus sp.]